MSGGLPAPGPAASATAPQHPEAGRPSASSDGSADPDSASCWDGVAIFRGSPRRAGGPRQSGQSPASQSGGSPDKPPAHKDEAERLARALHAIKSTSSSSLSATVLATARDLLARVERDAQKLSGAVGGGDTTLPARAPSSAAAATGASSGSSSELFPPLVEGAARHDGPAASATPWSDLAASLAALLPVVNELARQERVVVNAQVEPSVPLVAGKSIAASGPAWDSRAPTAAANAGSPALPDAAAAVAAPSAAGSCGASVPSAAPASGSGSAFPEGRPALPRPPTGSWWQGLPGGADHSLGSMLGRGASDASSPGVRILCIDGGSVRGLATLQALRSLERAAGRPIAELFDLIVGTSIGGYLSVCLGVRRMSIDECEAALWSTRRSMEAAQGNGIFSGARRVALGTAFDGKVHAESIVATLGPTARMDEVASSPKVALVATCIDRNPAKPFLFRTYSLSGGSSGSSSFEGTCATTQLEAARATTAAPTFFPPVEIGGRVFVDGACIANNPATIALAEAAALWPDAHVEAMVSVGTGLQSDAAHPGTSMVDWVAFQLNMSMDCTLAHSIAAAVLGRGRYWRFNFPSVGDVVLNETRIPVIEELVAKAKAHMETPQMRQDVADAAAALCGRSASTPERAASPAAAGPGAEASPAGTPASEASPPSSPVSPV